MSLRNSFFGFDGFFSRCQAAASKHVEGARFRKIGTVSGLNLGIMIGHLGKSATTLDHNKINYPKYQPRFYSIFTLRVYFSAMVLSLRERDRPK